MIVLMCVSSFICDLRLSDVLCNIYIFPSWSADTFAHLEKIRSRETLRKRRRGEGVDALLAYSALLDQSFVDATAAAAAAAAPDAVENSQPTTQQQQPTTASSSNMEQQAQQQQHMRKTARFRSVRSNL